MPEYASSRTEIRPGRDRAQARSRAQSCRSASRARRRKASMTASSSIASSRASWRRRAIPPAPAPAAPICPISRRNSRTKSICAARLRLARTQQSQQRQQPVLHLLRRCALARPPIFGLGQSDRSGMEHVDAIKKGDHSKAPSRASPTASSRCVLWVNADTNSHIA